MPTATAFWESAAEIASIVRSVSPLCETKLSQASVDTVMAPLSPTATACVGSSLSQATPYSQSPRSVETVVQPPVGVLTTALPPSPTATTDDVPSASTSENMMKSL